MHVQEAFLAMKKLQCHKWLVFWYAFVNRKPLTTIGQSVEFLPYTSWHWCFLLNNSPGSFNGIWWSIFSDGRSNKQSASDDSINSVMYFRLQDDQVHVLYLILKVGVIIWTWLFISLHVLCSPSCGAFSKCPSSCAMVKATLRPLSSTTEQLRIGSHILPSSANPKVSHLSLSEHRFFRVTRMAVS